MKWGPSTAREPGQFSGKRILVVGINYAPESVGIAPYTTGLCELLASQGADVTAIVGLPHYPAWSVAEGYCASPGAGELVNGVRVLRARHFVPSRQTALRRGLYEGSFLVSSRFAARKVASDAVVAISPSLSALRTGLAIARRDHAPFAAIVQDLMGSAARQSGIQGGSYVAGMVGRAERALLKQADQIGVISQTFVDTVVNYGVAAERISVMPNHSHIPISMATRNDSRIQLGWDPNEFVVLHTGNMGLKQDLSNVVEAARLASSSPAARDIRFILMGDGSQRTELETEVAELSNVTMLGPVEDRLYPIALAAADALLVNERPTVENMSLPSKLTSYFTAGRAVVAAVPSGGSTHREIERSGAGVTTSPGDPPSLLKTLVSLRNDVGLQTSLGLNGRQYAKSNLAIGVANGRASAFMARLLSLPDTPVQRRAEASVLDTREAIDASPASAFLGLGHDARTEFAWQGASDQP